MHQAIIMDSNSLAVHSELISRKKHCLECLQRIIFCDPKGWPYRYIVLLLLCYIYGAVMFSIEMIGGLNDTLIKVMKIDGTQYALLFSVFTWPSVVFCFFAGIIIDRVTGPRLGFLIAISVSIIGEWLVAIGGFVDYFKLMLVGRFIIGIGNELQLVLVLTYVVVWFGRKETSFAISLTSVAARLSDSAALILMQYIYDQFSFLLADPNYCLGATLMIGVLLKMGSLIALGLLIILEYNAGYMNTETNSSIRSTPCSIRNFITVDFWFVIIAMGIYIPIVFSFSSIGQHYFMQKYNFSIHVASISSSLVFLGVALIIPLFGIVISSVGYKLSWTLFGVVLGFTSHLLYLLTDIKHSTIVFVAGMIYSVSYATFFVTTLSYPGELVGKGQFSTAYGIMKSIQNLFYAIICLISGPLIDYAGFINLLLFYPILHLIVFLMFSVQLFRDNKLNVSHITYGREDSKASSQDLEYLYSY